MRSSCFARPRPHWYHAEPALVSCALQSEDADSDMSDAEGRGSVSEDESSMRPAARSKRLPGKCDSPDTQDSSEAVSHGGSKAGRGALPCRDANKGSGVGEGTVCFSGNAGRTLLRQSWSAAAWPSPKELPGAGRGLSDRAGKQEGWWKPSRTAAASVVYATVRLECWAWQLQKVEHFTC